MKKLITIFLIGLLICTTCITAYASDYEVMPCYNNVASVSTNFIIQSDGKAVVALGFTGYDEYTTGATITSKIQKKILWWWSDVDGASWNDEVVGDYYNIVHSFQLSSNGTYQLVYEYRISGNAGETDVISNTIQDTY